MMNHRPSPPPATTTIISKRHLFFIYLLLSFFLFSFQTAAQTIVYFLASFVDNHPSIQTPLHHLQNPLTSDQEHDHQLFAHPPPNPQPNATPLTLNRTRVSEIVYFGLNQEIEYSTWSHIFHAALFLFTFNGYIFTQSWAHGIIFVLIAYRILKADHNQSLIMILRKGAYLGFRRLSCFFVVRLMIRAATMELAKLVFGDIEDRCKYFVILNFIPFSHTLTWVEGFENDYSAFSISWLLLEMFVSSAFHAIVFVGMMDSRKGIPEVIREGFHLLSVRVDDAKYFKVTEYFVSRLVVAVILKEIFGELFASFIQSLVEGYFMVSWMIYYFHVKSMDANSRGLPMIGKRDLEAMLQEDIV